LAEVDGEGFRRTFSGGHILPWSNKASSRHESRWPFILSCLRVLSRVPDNQSLHAIDANDRVHALYALELPEVRETNETDGEFVSIVFVNVLTSAGEEGKGESTTRYAPLVFQILYTDCSQYLLSRIHCKKLNVNPCNGIFISPCEKRFFVNC
jgi:hypothetical protein